MTAAIALIIGVTTLCGFIIAFVALLARASGADATIIRLRGELHDEVEHGLRIERDLTAARQEAADAKLESGECQKQIAMLTGQLTQRAQVDKLADIVSSYRNDLAGAIGALHDDLATNASLLQQIVGLLEPTRAQLEGDTP